MVIFKHLLRSLALFIPMTAIAQPATAQPDAVAQAAAQFSIDACILHAATFDQFQQWGKENHLAHPAHVSHGFQAVDIFINSLHFEAWFSSPSWCFVDVPRADNRHVAEYMLQDLREMHARFSPMWNTPKLGQNFYQAGELVYIGRKRWELTITGGDGELPDAVPEISHLGIAAFLDPASKS